MISVLRTCFNTACRLALLAWFATVVPAVTVTGKVELRDSKDPTVRKKMDFSGVVVWLEPLKGKAAPPSGFHARMIQKSKTFAPHILAVPVGATVDFPNLDPIFHNVFSTYDGQPFDLALYPPGKYKSFTFTQPGIVRVFCNIHSSMSAVIAVLDTPFFDTSKKDGSIAFTNVPAGEYRLHLFHERATQTTLAELARAVNVAGDGVELAPIVISESGYLAIPHLNKFGREYPPAPDDDGVYPAVRK